MDKSGKIYVKAMNKYNDGYIDRSLALCEKCISVNITNAAALNLRGILYYLKGDLENAKRMWNINYKRNHDEVSKKYLKDSIKDVEKLHMYYNALDLIVEFNISGALDILKQCENSHFNFINVNNSISLCYIKRGEYDKALQHINEVLKVDKKNMKAITNKKTLIKYGNIKREINYKKSFIIAGSILLAITIFLLGKTYWYKLRSASMTVSTTDMKQGQPKLKLNKNKDKEESVSVIKTVTEEKFPKEQFVESIKNNNMEKIIECVNLWKDAKDANLAINDKLLMVEGEEIIKKDGIAYFYEKGMSYMHSEKYTEAQKYFLYALPYSKDNYLNQHIIYMLALCYKYNSDFENAIKYYELTLNKFPSGSYTEEVLYNLILINKDVDLNKAKNYAKKLMKQFPSSGYNNSIVKNIIDS
ncbi:tetratricopeptide repeat protein [Clostridium sp.]|uniref:tetratricopeptide repeat protein n=1 Tax=Clostridium sp. TaxID=1506 RepID=UPI001A45F9C5|nr:tetratricopeptide repeat protein [Clostridium sp.]MBK5240837.1 tetratricopeptide repeat protein [Clostridium sp.]